MPVDLSRVGLEGIETAQRTLNSIANRDIAYATEQREAEDFQYKEAQKQIELQAFENAKTLLGGGSVSSADPEGAGGGNVGAFLEKWGILAAEAGAPTRGVELIKEGIDVRKKLADIEKGKDDQTQTRLENISMVADYVATNIGANENEFQHFIADLESKPELVAIFGPDNLEMLKQQKWSPALANFYRDKAISTKDRATFDLSALRIQQTERSMENTEAYRASQSFIGKENLRLREAEQKARVKSDGPKILASPKTADLDAARNLIVSKVFGGNTPAEGAGLDTLIVMTQDIASRANQLVTQQKGWDYSTALNRAMAEAEANGDLVAKTTETLFGFGPDKTTTKYKPRGRTEADPLPIPKDASKLIPGRFYKSNGQVKQFNP